jgi:hypothetical protein
MSKIKIKKGPEEVYFKTVTQYHFEIDGKDLVINYEEDNNGAEAHYLIDEKWSLLPPSWLADVVFEDIYNDEYSDFAFDNWFNEMRYTIAEGEIYESTTGEQYGQN